MPRGLCWGLRSVDREYYLVARVLETSLGVSSSLKFGIDVGPVLGARRTPPVIVGGRDVRVAVRALKPPAVRLGFDCQWLHAFQNFLQGVLEGIR